MFFNSSAGLIRMRVLLEGASLSRIYGISTFMSVLAIVDVVLMRIVLVQIHAASVVGGFIMEISALI